MHNPTAEICVENSTSINTTSNNIKTNNKYLVIVSKILHRDLISYTYNAQNNYFICVNIIYKTITSP